jgi:hypothetical protein
MRNGNWTKFEIRVLKAMYPETESGIIAETLGRETHSVYNKAHNLGLRKSKDFKKNKTLENLPFFGKSFQFKKGHTPANKGCKASDELKEKLKPTMFKKGHLPHNAKPHGYEATDKEGYVKIKLDGLPKMVSKHRHLWESENGNIPDGMILVFKNGTPLFFEA